MATRPTAFPRWATDANRTLEPSSGEKDTGWEVRKKPPARKMNWLQYLAYLWALYHDDEIKAVIEDIGLTIGAEEGQLLRTIKAMIGMQVYSNWANLDVGQNFDMHGIAYNSSGWVIVGKDDTTRAIVLRNQYEGDPSAAWSQATAGLTKAVDLYDVASDGTTFCAAGEADGADAYIVTATDGLNWTERANPANFTLRRVVFANSIWVAVGDPTGTRPYLITASDPTGAWTQNTSPAKNFALYGVAYDGSGLWVAVGVADGTDAYLLTASDPTGTWTERSNPKNFDLYGVAYGNGKWVAAGGADGTDAYIVTSTDGVTWVEQANPQNIALTDVHFVSGPDVFVAVGLLGAAGPGSYILMSPDGETWTQVPCPGNVNLRRIFSDGSRAMIVGDDDGPETAAFVMRSPRYR